MDEEEFVQAHFAILQVGPDDVLVVRYEQRLTQDTAHMIARSIRNALGHSKVLILDGGADLAVIKKDAA